MRGPRPGCLPTERPDAEQYHNPYRSRHLSVSSLCCVQSTHSQTWGVFPLSSPAQVSLGSQLDSLFAPQWLCFEIDRTLCGEETRVWCFLKAAGHAEGGLAPTSSPSCTHTPPIMPLMRPLLRNACGRLLHSWKAHPRNGFKVVQGCGLQSLGSSSPQR